MGQIIVGEHQDMKYYKKIINLNKILFSIKRIPYNIKKYCYCKYFHKNDICHPKDPKGNWHCSKCHPCGEIFDILIKIAEKKKKNITQEQNVLDLR